MITIRCEPPAGCGWWWQVNTERIPRRHWWSASQVHLRYHGPHFPDGGDAARWHTEEQFEGNYGDCWSHLKMHHGEPAKVT